jgi:hypothetical protein
MTPTVLMQSIFSWVVKTEWLSNSNMYQSYQTNSKNGKNGQNSKKMPKYVNRALTTILGRRSVIKAT